MQIMQISILSKFFLSAKLFMDVVANFQLFELKMNKKKKVLKKLKNFFWRMSSSFVLCQSDVIWFVEHDQIINCLLAILVSPQTRRRIIKIIIVWNKNTFAALERWKSAAKHVRSNKQMLTHLSSHYYIRSED